MILFQPIPYTHDITTKIIITLVVQVEIELLILSLPKTRDKVEANSDTAINVPTMVYAVDFISFGTNKEINM